VFDESPSEEHIVALLGEWSILDQFDADAVGNDFESVTISMSLLSGLAASWRIGRLDSGLGSEANGKLNR
jgi:hypothetical protein